MLNEKEEKIIDLRMVLAKIQSQINEIYPFNIIMQINPEKTHNGFIITIDKKSFKKYGKDVLEEIFKYFKMEFKVNADLIYEKRKKSFFSKDIQIYYVIKIN